MWIVRLALRRPYTFVVLAVLILIVGPLAILRTPTDIFPTHRYPGGQHRLDIQRLFNDRLLLGLKGTMSEAELHILRARLDGDIRNKVARGALRRE
ncbi:hypothetical protein OKW28_003483 [Paraburkholderia sp. 40]